MKKILILSALMTALTSAGAMAADANVNFTGSVSAATCTLNAADASKTLTVPSVSPQVLYGLASPTYATYTATGSFEFTACPAGLTRVTSAYTYQGATGSANPTMAIATGTATNIGMVLLQSTTATGTLLNVNGTSGVANQANIVSNAATIPVTVGVQATNSNGTGIGATLPTVGTYTGTYLVAFTYS